MLKISVENSTIFLNVENFAVFHNTKFKFFKNYRTIKYN